MRNLACTFNVNGIPRRVCLKKIAKERKFRVTVEGVQMEYSLTEEDTIKPVNGGHLPDNALLPHIEWMIRHYFNNTKQLI
jgi:hypothetical protein